MSSSSFELKWTGDFTVPRYRAALSKFAELPTRGGNDYTDVFNYDRGGKCPVPYSVYSQVPPPRTDSLPTLLRMDSGSSKHTSRNTGRLPIIPPRLKTLKKSTSCVFLRTPFVGTFGTQQVDAAPELDRRGRKSDKGEDEGGAEKKLDDAKLVASRKLWRVSSTADVYFKAQPDDPSVKIPQMEDAIKEGALIDYKNPDCDGMTLFMRSCSTNNLDLAKYLKDNHGADVLALDNIGRNAFHHTALQNAFVVQTWLLRELAVTGQGTNQLLAGKDIEGDTPLHKSAQSGAIVVADLLLRGGKGKDMVKVPNNAGEIPYEVAKKYKMHHMLKLLDPLEYVKDQTSLIYRMKGGDGDEEERDEDEEDEDDEDDEEEDKGAGGGGKKFRNLVKMDRKCNQAAAEKVLGKKEKKGKKGGKKGKKKK